jgi:uncharacterized protein YcfL
MRYLIILLNLFILVACTSDKYNPKFHYNQSVLISKGFFKSCIGTVMHWEDRYYQDVRCYNLISVRCSNKVTDLSEYCILESHLEAIK